MSDRIFDVNPHETPAARARAGAELVAAAAAAGRGCRGLFTLRTHLSST